MFHKFPLLQTSFKHFSLHTKNRNLVAKLRKIGRNSKGRGRGTRFSSPSSPRGGWARAKVGGLTTCQVLEVPRGRVGRGGGKGIAISLIAGSSTMAGVSRVVVARGTIIRPAKNLVTIGETTSSDQVPMFSRPPPYQLARSRYHLSPPSLPPFLPSFLFVRHIKIWIQIFSRFQYLNYYSI